MFKKFFSLKKLCLANLILLLFFSLNSCTSYKKSKTTSNFHICTIASHETNGLKQLLNSCKHFNVPIKVIGLGLPYRGNSEKLLHMKKFLKTLPDNDIVLFVDAYDVLFMNTKEEILKRFLSMKVPFVISVEMYCWPLVDRKEDFPPSPTPFRFINSGSYIGYVKEIKEILEAITNIDPAASDQGRFMLHYFDHPKKYAFDYYCKLFIPLPKVSNHDLEMDQKKLTVKCKITETFPCIIHGNGSGRYLYQYIYDYLFIHNPYLDMKTEIIENKISKDISSTKILSSDNSKLKEVCKVKDLISSDYTKMTLDQYLSQKGNWTIEGHCQRGNTQQPQFLSDLAKNPNISTIGEIGFNAGHSADLFLKSNKKAKVYSFDIMEHPYAIHGKEYINLKYPKRHKLIKGNSLISVPRFDKNIKFDLIFIDGGHTFIVSLCDIINMRFYANKNTILVIDDIKFPTVKKAWQYCVDHGIITSGKFFPSGYKGWQQCKYIF